MKLLVWSLAALLVGATFVTCAHKQDKVVADPVVFVKASPDAGTVDKRINDSTKQLIMNCLDYRAQVDSEKREPDDKLDELCDVVAE